MEFIWWTIHALKLISDSISNHSADIFIYTYISSGWFELYAHILCTGRECKKYNYLQEIMKKNERRSPPTPVDEWKFDLVESVKNDSRKNSWTPEPTLAQPSSSAQVADILSSYISWVLVRAFPFSPYCFLITCFYWCSFFTRWPMFLLPRFN